MFFKEKNMVEKVSGVNPAYKPGEFATANSSNGQDK
jgi:hypothetical protein